jgi:hypothetical protein
MSENLRWLYIHCFGYCRIFLSAIGSLVQELSSFCHDFAYAIGRSFPLIEVPLERKYAVKSVYAVKELTEEHLDEGWGYLVTRIFD